MTARKIRFGLWICVLVAALGLVLSLPATLMPRLISSVFSDQPAPVTIVEPQGRLWSGLAQQMILRPDPASSNQLLLEGVQWRLQWAGLLRGNICLRLSSDSSQRPFEGLGCLARSGQVTLQEAEFAFPASELMAGQFQGSALLQALSNAIQIEGQIMGQIKSLQWQSGNVQTVEATGSWADAALVLAVADPRTGAVSRQTLELGEMPWRLQSTGPDELQMQVDMDNTASDLLLSSQSRLWLNGRYETELRVGVKPSTPGFLRDMLRLMTEEIEPGVYRLYMRN